MDNEISPRDFWTCINIWIKNPHVVNRRLCGVKFITSCRFTASKQEISLLVNELICEEYNDNFNTDVELLGTAKNYTEFENLQEVDFQKCLEDNMKDDNSKISQNVVMIVQQLLPKGLKFKNGYRFCVLDYLYHSTTFINKFNKDNQLLESTPIIPYCVKYGLNNISLEFLSVDGKEKDLNWLKNTLLPKLKKWANSDADKCGLVDGSLNLVPLDKYNCKYQYLKLKYGQEMVKVWPECTDPSKFVYEDVAIATYLLLLWEEERERLNKDIKQSFIDLGCGNGLLVYILASEGHPGKGVDVRKRDIWNLYPDFVKLEVDAITPSAKYLYKDYDWIIGNHSDELTPWIPVIAARSSYNTNFFLLPCCAYEFNGKKYQRTNSSKSQYLDYMEYVMEICIKCGIQTSIDRLKIPSTKRVCLVGTKRLYAEECFNNKLYDIKKFIDARCENNSSISVPIKNDNDLDCWAPNFIPRNSTEKVSNCTKIDRRVIEEIVESVTRNLLKEKNYANSKWNAGGCISLSDIVRMLPVDKLKFLKQECGGLQTLLRNNHHIFEVVGGKVKLRYPRTKSEVMKQLAEKQSKKKKVKSNVVLNKKSCWFYEKHPDGCPLLEDECSYIHK